MLYKMFEALGIQSSPGSPVPPKVNPRHQPKLQQASTHGTHLFVLEPSGACDPALTSLLRTISKSVGLPGVQDSTVYGTSRASTRSFFYHHLAATSAAIVQQDALTIVSYASAESFRLTLSPSPSSAPAGSFGGRRA